MTSIYGTTQEEEATLRLYSNGLLNTTTTEFGELPYTINSVFQSPPGVISLSPVISCLTIVLIREHNRKAHLVKLENPSLSDDEIFQRSKTWVIAVVQRITYEQVYSRVL
jgi:hypothetical protein